MEFHLTYAYDGQSRQPIYFSPGRRTGGGILEVTRNQTHLLLTEKSNLDRFVRRQVPIHHIYEGNGIVKLTESIRSGGGIKTKKVGLAFSRSNWLGVAVGVIETIGGEEDRLRGKEGQRIRANSLGKDGGGQQE